jgi:hypothetical protein
MTFKDYITSQIFNLYLRYLRYSGGSLTYKQTDEYDFESQLATYFID